MTKAEAINHLNLAAMSLAMRWQQTPTENEVYAYIMDLYGSEKGSKGWEIVLLNRGFMEA